MNHTPPSFEDGPFDGLEPSTIKEGVSPRLTVQQRPAHSGLPIALALFALLVFSRGWVRAVSGFADVDVDSSAVVRNLFIPAYLAGLVLLVGDPRRSLRAVVAGAVPLTLVGVAFASTAWSIAPDLTERRALALLFTTLTAIALAARLDWLDLARAIAGAFSLLALGSAALAVALPWAGRMQTLFPGAWRGLWSEKNALGDYMALGVCACLSAALMDRRLRMAWIGGSVLCLLLIILSTSKTSLVCLSAGLAALIAVLLARRSPAIAVSVVFVGGVMAIACAMVMTFAPHLAFDILGKDSTLTGRTAVWQAVLRRVAERPLTGYGYSVVWTDTSGTGPLAWISKELHFTPHHAHNSWLNVQLELGVAGLALLTLFAAQTLWRLLRAGEGVVLAAPLLTAFFGIALTETVAVNYNDYMWVIIPAVAVRLGIPTITRAKD